jgi:hypothetical protein
VRRDYDALRLALIDVVYTAMFTNKDEVRGFHDPP